MKLYKVYQVEVGVLLDQKHPEYEDYSNVWDHKHGYFDEEFMICKNYKEAKEYLEDYIKCGVKNTYGILSEIYIKQQGYDSIDENVEPLTFYMDYDVQSVIYSAYKDENNEIIENFVDNKNHNIENDEVEELE